MNYKRPGIYPAVRQRARSRWSNQRGRPQQRVPARRRRTTPQGGNKSLRPPGRPSRIRFQRTRTRHTGRTDGASSSLAHRAQQNHGRDTVLPAQWLDANRSGSNRGASEAGTNTIILRQLDGPVYPQLYAAHKLLPFRETTARHAHACRPDAEAEMATATSHYRDVNGNLIQIFDRARRQEGAMVRTVPGQQSFQDRIHRRRQILSHYPAELLVGRRAPGKNTRVLELNRMCSEWSRGRPQHQPTTHFFPWAQTRERRSATDADTPGPGRTPLPMIRANRAIVATGASARHTVLTASDIHITWSCRAPTRVSASSTSLGFPSSLSRILPGRCPDHRNHYSHDRTQHQRERHFIGRSSRTSDEPRTPQLSTGVDIRSRTEDRDYGQAGATQSKRLHAAFSHGDNLSGSAWRRCCWRSGSNIDTASSPTTSGATLRPGSRTIGG